MRRTLLFSIVCTSALWLALAQHGSGEWKLGILDGYHLFSINSRSGATSTAIDLRGRWDQKIFFRSEQQLERQGHTYPSVSILASASKDGRFLANLWGLAYREDGPLVLAEIGTGKVLNAFPISGSGIVAAFVPPDNRRVVASWRDLGGGSHNAVLDASTGQLLAELPSGQLPASSYFFSGSPPFLLFMPASPSGEVRYELLPTDSWRGGKPLELPAGNYTVLDMRKDTLLLESRGAMITVSAWSKAHPESSPVLVDSREYGGNAALRYVLADQGQRVVRWNEGAPTFNVILYDSVTGHISARTKINGSVRGYALNHDEKIIAFAVDRSILFIGASDGRLISHRGMILSARGELSLFWFL